MLSETLKNKKILIIVPAYNEQDSVKSVVIKTRRCLPQADILVVNDGSTDDTSAIAKSCADIVLDLPYNLGIGAAMQTGYKYAHYENYDYAVQCDGDGQHHPSQIIKLLEGFNHKEDVDMVLGSRFISSRKFRSSPARRLGMIILSSVLSKMTRQKITDTTSGFRAVGKEVIKSFSIYYPDDYPEPEALVLLHREGFKIREVPVSMSSRKNGQSSIDAYKSIYYMIKVLMAVFIDLCKDVPFKKHK